MEIIESPTREQLEQVLEAIRKGEATAEVLIAEAKPCD
jgi:hypothetical protein